MPGVRIAVTSSYSGKGFAAGGAQLDALNKKAEQASSRMSASLTSISKGFETASKKMGAAGDFMVKRATLPIVAALGLATKAAMDDQQSQAILANQLRNSVGPSDAMRASVERSIRSWQDQYGILADQLRPAYADLIRATHNVSGANALMSLAINISAARHLVLEKVTLALSKAQNGNVAGLTRLGVKVKDAAGHTLKFAQIQAELNKTFAGAAATAADTAAGRMAVLHARFHDLAIQVGDVLLPIVENIVARLGQFVGWIDKLNPSILKWVVYSLLAIAAIGPLLKILSSFALGISKLAGLLAGISAPVLIAIAVIVALAAGFIYLWRTSDTFREKVRAVWAEFQMWLGVAKSAWFAFLAAFHGFGVADGGIVGFAARVGEAARDVQKWLMGTALPAIVRFAKDAPGRLVAFAEGAKHAGQQALAGIRVFITWFQTYVLPVLQRTVGYIVVQFSELAQFIASRWGDIRDAIHNVLMVIVGIVVAVLAVLIVAWRMWGDDVWRYVKRVWSAVRVEIQGAFEIIKGIFDVVLALLTGHWSRAWSGIKEILHGVLLFILADLKLAWATIQAVFAVALSALLALWTLVWNEIKALPGQVLTLILAAVKLGLDAVYEYFVGIPAKILGLVGSFAAAAGSIGKAIMDGIIGGITGAVSFVGSLAKALGSAFIGFINDHIIHPINDAIGAIGFSILGHHIGLPKHLIPDIPGAWRGADVVRGGSVLVGERGAEIVDLPAGARVNPHGTGSSAGGHTFQFYGATGTPDELAHAMLWQLRAAG